MHATPSNAHCRLYTYRKRTTTLSTEKKGRYVVYIEYYEGRYRGKTVTGTSRKLSETEELRKRKKNREREDGNEE